MRRHVGVSVALLALVAVALGLLAGESDREPVPTETRAPLALPADLAEVPRIVCRRVFVDFLAQLAADAAAGEVLADLRQTRELARDAVEVGADAVGLWSATGALVEGLEADDPTAVDLAVRVLRAECQRQDPGGPADRLAPAGGS